MGLWALPRFSSSPIRCLALCVLTVSACAERPAAPTLYAASPMSIRVVPQILFAGQAVRVSCFVPWDDNNRAVRFGIEGMNMASTEIDRVQYTRVYERMECGTWTATCSVADHMGKLAVRSEEITVKGLCDGSGDAR